MTTSSNPDATASRGALRLRLADPAAGRPLDGGWWPHSRQLLVELADLVDNFPPERGRIVRATFSPPDWDDAPNRVPISRGYVQVGSAPKDDTHVIVLRTSERQELVLLVVPPDMSEAQGEAALQAAVSTGPRVPPVKVLADAARL